MKKLKSFITFLRKPAKYVAFVVSILSTNYIFTHSNSIFMSFLLTVVATIVIFGSLIALDAAEYVLEQKIAKREEAEEA